MVSVYYYGRSDDTRLDWGRDRLWVAGLLPLQAGHADPAACSSAPTDYSVSRTTGGISNSSPGRVHAEIIPFRLKYFVLG